MAAGDRVVAVVNGKGGVGKTTITANIGGLLAASDQRILLVDMDPQGNLAEELGYTQSEANDEGSALAQALTFGSPLTPQPTGRPRLEVIMGGDELHTASAGLAAKANKDSASAKLALARALAPLTADYDLILVDCPPGEETLQQAALAAARWALIPIKSDSSSRKGLSDVARRLDSVLDVNPGLDLLGVVLFAVGTSARVVRETARQGIMDVLGSADALCTSTIRHAEAPAQESRELGLLTFELEKRVLAGPTWWQRRQNSDLDPDAPRSRSAVRVSDDFQALAQELIARIGIAEEAAMSPEVAVTTDIGVYPPVASAILTVAQPVL
ncbi:MAG: ParA family protein [Angustibacter sp.]